MARQRIHNRRASRGAQGGFSWISYSDMMAALLLIFVLILTYSLYQYFTMLETKTLELDLKTTELEEQKIALNIATDELNAKEQALIIIQTDLDELKDTLSSKEDELNNAKATLIIQQQALEEAKAKLEEQQLALAAQTKRIDDLIGIRTTIISDLSKALTAADMKATVDPNNGDVWIDTVDGSIKQWSTYTTSWAIIETVYTRVTFHDQGNITSTRIIWERSLLKAILTRPVPMRAT